MNTKILGASCTITSNLKVEDIVKLKKFSPRSLVIKDHETKSEIFKIGYTEAAGQISPYGITFDSQNTEGFAQITFPIPATVTAAERKQFIQDNVGLTLMSLEKMESAIAAELIALNTQFDAIGETINTLD